MVHGRSDLMAHVRQKSALQPGEFSRAFQRLRQLPLDAPPFGYVKERRPHPGDAPITAANVILLNLDCKMRAVLPDIVADQSAKRAAA